MSEWITDSNPTKNGEYLVTRKWFSEHVVRIRSWCDNLYRLDNDTFPKEKYEGKGGWYDYDSEIGFREEHSIVAWQELPEPHIEKRKGRKKKNV